MWRLVVPAGSGVRGGRQCRGGADPGRTVRGQSRAGGALPGQPQYVVAYLDDRSFPQTGAGDLPRAVFGVDHPGDDHAAARNLHRRAGVHQQNPCRPGEGGMRDAGASRIPDPAADPVPDLRRSDHDRGDQLETRIGRAQTAGRGRAGGPAVQADGDRDLLRCAECAVRLGRCRGTGASGGDRGVYGRRCISGRQHRLRRRG